MIWVLVIVLHFSLDRSTLELPSARTYETHDFCEHDGKLLSEWLTQDGDIKVDYRCVTPPVCESEYCI